MKQFFTFLILLVFASAVTGQKRIESFDVPLENGRYSITNFISNDSTSISHSLDTLNVYEGKASLKIEYNIKCLDSWGSRTTLATLLPSDNEHWDFSGYDKISFSLYNELKSPVGSTYLRFIVYDNSEFPTGNAKEFWVSYHWPFDLEPGWNTITVPLKDVGSTAQTVPGSGFWLNGDAGQLGNEMLDLDKIKGVGFSIVATGPADGRNLSGTFLVDNLHLVGKNTTTAINTLKTEPTGFSLEQNYPNPFQNETTVKFKIPKQQKVTLSIFDVSGKAINVLINETLNPGDYKVNFSAKNLPSGVYYYQLRTGEFLDTKKFIIK